MVPASWAACFPIVFGVKTLPLLRPRIHVRKDCAFCQCPTAHITSGDRVTWRHDEPCSNTTQDKRARAHILSWAC
eukprot:312749-Amphidinium_carterae.1